MKKPIGEKLASHIVAKVSGVTADDSRLEAARKAIETMKLAGFSKRDIAAAERMYERAKARGVT